MDAASLRNELRLYFQQTPVPVVCAWLFGSYARGEEAGDSDVDVAVLLPDNVGGALVGPVTKVRGDLERLLRRDVDIVDLRRAPADLVHRVLRDGELLIERDASQRALFEVEARNRYFDVLPHLRRYRGRAPA